MHSDTPNSHRLSGILFGILAALIWGGFLTVSRHGIVAGLHGSDLAVLRYGVAGLLLLPLLLKHGVGTLAGVGWIRGSVLALLAGPLFVLVGASGYLFAPLAHGAVIQPGTLTLASAILSVLLLGERLAAARLPGFALLIAGLGCIAGPALLAGGSQAWIGDLLFALAGSMFAAFTALVRRWKITALTATIVVSVLSGAVYVPLYLLFVGGGRLLQSSPAMIFEQIVVQALLSGIVAMYAFAQAVHRLGASRAALFPALAPAVAILLGIPLMGEFPTGYQWLGLVVASLGLLLALREPKADVSPDRASSRTTLPER